jgi:hypothetical protein
LYKTVVLIVWLADTTTEEVCKEADDDLETKRADAGRSRSVSGASSSLASDGLNEGWIV